MSEKPKYSIVNNIPPIPGAQYYEYEDFNFPHGDIREFPIPNVKGMERFLPLLPVSGIPAALARGVGNTPVSRLDNMGVEIGLQNLWVKHEEVNPTGSAKDRGSLLVIAYYISQYHRWYFKSLYRLYEAEI